MSTVLTGDRANLIGKPPGDLASVGYLLEEEDRRMLCICGAVIDAIADGVLTPINPADGETPARLARGSGAEFRT